MNTRPYRITGIVGRGGGGFVRKVELLIPRGLKLATHENKAFRLHPVTGNVVLVPDVEVLPPLPEEAGAHSGDRSPKSPTGNEDVATKQSQQHAHWQRQIRNPEFGAQLVPSGAVFALKTVVAENEKDLAACVEEVRLWSHGTRPGTPGLIISWRNTFFMWILTCSDGGGGSSCTGTPAGEGYVV